MREPEPSLFSRLQVVLYSWMFGYKTAGGEARWWIKQLLGRWAGLQIIEVYEREAINSGIAWQNQDISMVIC